MNLDFFVSCRKLTQKGTCSPVADTAACDTFTVSFDKEWDGLVKLVEFRNADATAQVFYTGKMPLPQQVCGRGALYLTCYGYRQKGDDVAVIRTVPMVRPVLMAGSAAPQGAASQPYAPSAFDRMAAQVAAANAAAAKAEQISQELLALKQADAFRGPAGPAATVRIDSIRHGSPACVDNLGTENHALLRFTLPWKLTEEEKELLKTEFLGDVDTALDGILALQEACIEGTVTA